MQLSQQLDGLIIVQNPHLKWMISGYPSFQETSMCQHVKKSRETSRASNFLFGGRQTSNQLLRASTYYFLRRFVAIKKHKKKQCHGKIRTSSIIVFRRGDVGVYSHPPKKIENEILLRYWQVAFYPFLSFTILHFQRHANDFE